MIAGVVVILRGCKEILSIREKPRAGITWSSEVGIDSEATITSRRSARERTTGRRPVSDLTLLTAINLLKGRKGD